MSLSVSVKNADLSSVVRLYVAPINMPNRGRADDGLFFGTDTYVAPSTSTEPTIDDNPPDGVIVWAASQDSETTTLDAQGISVSWDDADTFDYQYSETQHTSHVERIFNPDDDTQWVDVEVYDDISFKNGKNIPSNYSFAPVL